MNALVRRPSDLQRLRQACRRAYLSRNLRKRGLTPWFWIKDAGPNWLDDELTSIEKQTPVSAVFGGAAGWGPNYHRKLAEVAFRSGRPTILVLLPGPHPEDVQSFPHPGTGKRRWVEFKTLDEGSALTELAQQIVDGAYEPRAEPAAEPQARQQQAGGSRRLMVYVPACSQSLYSWDSLRNRLSREPDLRGCVWYGHSYVAGVWSPLVPGRPGRGAGAGHRRRAR